MKLNFSIYKNNIQFVHVVHLISSEKISVIIFCEGPSRKSKIQKCFIHRRSVATKTRRAKRFSEKPY